jgi:hypothetical protein
MTTFELDEVRAFVASLRERMERCANGEGMECATFETALTHYARLCCEYNEAVRQWGRAIFSGTAAYNEEAEAALHDEGIGLLLYTSELLGRSRALRIQCFILDGHERLESALSDLTRLLENWVTPSLAVGPMARNGLAIDSKAAEEFRRRVAALAPLSAGQEPGHPASRGKAHTL